MTKTAPSLKPGDTAPDGSIYLGYSGDGFHRGRDWYVAAEDAKDTTGKNLCMTFNEATDYTRTLKSHGHDDWRLPDRAVLEEMRVQKHNGSFKGTFNEVATDAHEGFYWSSSIDPVKSDWGHAAIGLSLSENRSAGFNIDYFPSKLAVRAVRSVPRGR